MRRGGGNQQLPRILGRPDALKRNQNPNPNALTPKQQRRLMRQQQQRP
jgi:hypothetical protein